MTTPISASMVENITISNRCIPAHEIPCSHWCIATLNDTRSRWVMLSGQEIALLIKTIAKKKITGAPKGNHFTSQIEARYRNQRDDTHLAVNKLLHQIFTDINGIELETVKELEDARSILMS